MHDVPLSEICVCGGNQWHVVIDRVLWCKRCGCMRAVFDRKWRVPLDRAGELPAVKIERDEPTDPGTPDAKKSDDEWEPPFEA